MEASEAIKDGIIAKLGGVSAVARICGLTAGAVSQWKLIPAKHQPTLLQVAVERGIDVTPESFIPMPNGAPHE